MYPLASELSKMRSYSIIFALILIVAVCCTKEDPFPRTYPRVLTSEVSQITDGGAVFSGEITYASVSITDHGFVWSNIANFDPHEGDELSLGPKTEKGQFSAPCTYGLKSGDTYYVRAYAKSANYSVYGDVMTFKSEGSEAVELKDFYPKDGTWDERITLLGKNFTAVETNLKVNFGGYEAFVVHSSADTAIVQVPYSLDAKESTISVSFGRSNSTLPIKFVLKEPKITSISPTSGADGTEVTITGDNFSGPHVRVLFGGVEGTLKQISRTKLICTIPEGMAAGKLKVAVSTGLVDMVDEIDFEIK